MFGCFDLAKRAFENTPLDPAVKSFTGATGILTGEGDFPEICRIAVDWSKKLEGRLELRGGAMDNRTLTTADIRQLARWVKDRDGATRNVCSELVERSAWHGAGERLFLPLRRQTM